MTAFDPQLAARVAESGIPLSADCAPLTPARLSEIKSLLRYETSISFHSARAKESMLLLVTEVERLRGGQTDPLIVRRIDMVVEPARFEGETETLVACIAEDGRPVALLLDDETRARLARNLRMDGGES